MTEILDKLKNVKTMTELDSLRLEIVRDYMDEKETFEVVQLAFIKAKNRLRRIPLRDRNW